MTKTYLSLLPKYFPPESPSSNHSISATETKSAGDVLPRSKSKDGAMLTSPKSGMGRLSPEKVKSLRERELAHGANDREAEMDTRVCSSDA